MFGVSTPPPPFDPSFREGNQKSELFNNSGFYLTIKIFYILLNNKIILL